MEKCSNCNRESYSYVNGIPLCVNHYIQESWKDNLECLKDHLDTFIDRLEKNNKLDEKEIEFLKALKVEIPEIVQEFPVLFEGL